jgi:hypothetical protein
MLMVKEAFCYDFIYDWVLIPMTEQINRSLNKIDDLLQIEDELTKEEEEEVQSLLRKYENDPTVIDYKLEEIRRQNKKFDIIVLVV